MSKVIAKQLLDIEAVFLNVKSPFTWASGIKSPIYCDNRLILSEVEVRNSVENELAKLIKEMYPDCTNVVGTATAGIAHAAIVAHLLNLPNSYVRNSNKEHGRQNQIEGKIIQSDKVVIVEDLISTGGSVIKVANTLKKLGVEVLGVVSIFSYQLEKGLDNFAKENLNYLSLTNINELVDVAVDNNYISAKEKTKILQFIKNPSDDSWINNK
ncbi:MAG: orotate phosphoribosyltransferase [Bacilli bacterium]